MGYEALAAMRAAIADSSTAGATVVPLALDSGGDPALAQRALRKLLADPELTGFVGPLLPSTAAGIADVEPVQTNAHGLLPFAASADSFVAMEEWKASDDWARTLVAAVGEVTQSEGATRLALADIDEPFAAGWPQLDAGAWSQTVGMPVALVDNVEAVQPGDAVLWLGTSVDAATFINELHSQQPAVPVWLGPPGNVDAVKDRLAKHDKVYWATWQHEDYAAWAEMHDDASPLAHAVYLATRQIIEGKAPPPNWEIALWEMQADGTSVPFVPGSTE